MNRPRRRCTLRLVIPVAMLAASAAVPAGAAVTPYTWSQLSPAPPTPETRERISLVHDAARDEIVLFGGRAGTGLHLDDTWVWNGESWAGRSPATRPPARGFHAMAYDAARERVVMFGGFDTGTDAVFADTWEWDGATWAARTPATSPPARLGAAMAYDEDRGRVVLFGGRTGAAGARLNDTWEWDGTSWEQRTPATSPPARSHSAMAYDPIRDRTLMFSGCCAGADTWEWDGTTWSQLTPATSPPQRERHALAFDRTRGRVILTGGFWSPTYFGDTWEWNGTTWVQRSPTDGYGARAGHGMATDNGGRTVLFGGHFGGVTYGDTRALVDPAPAITGFSPATGNTADNVTISGSAFTDVTGVSFGNLSAAFTVDSDSQITATVPAGNANGLITVVGPGGSARSIERWVGFLVDEDGDGTGDDDDNCPLLANADQLDTDLDGTGDVCDPDDDNDRIDDAIDPAPLTPGSRFDNGPTAGVIAPTPSGATVYVVDMPAPDGVRVIVEGESNQKVIVALDNKASVIRIPVPGDAVVTDPVTDTTVDVVVGPVEVVLTLNGSPIVISIEDGASATLREITDESGTLTDISVLDVTGDPGAVTINGAPADPDEVLTLGALSGRLSVRQGAFTVSGTFTPNPDGDGVISPLAEGATLLVGAYVFDVPAESFTLAKGGAYTFSGSVGGVAVTLQLKPAKGGRWTVKAGGSPVTGFSNPVSLGVSIGNDLGLTTVSANLS